MSTVNFTTTEKLSIKLKKLAAEYNLDFNANDDTIIERRLSNAYEAIVSVLVPRGLTLVQISTWRRGEEFQLDIATFWYCKDCGWGGKDQDGVDWTTVFNRVKELDTVAIINNDGELLSRTTTSAAVGMDLIAINDSLGIRH
jgi:hypothetical protein